MVEISRHLQCSRELLKHGLSDFVFRDHNSVNGIYDYGGVVFVVAVYERILFDYRKTHK